MTTPTMAMVVYWRLQIGLRAFLDRGRDLLHARAAGVGAITDEVAQMPYTIESAPQSTITHKAVMEVASNLGLSRPCARPRRLSAQARAVP